MDYAYDAAFLAGSRERARGLARLYQQHGSDAFLYFDPDRGDINPETKKPMGAWRLETGRPSPIEKSTLKQIEVYPAQAPPVTVEQLPKEPYRPLPSIPAELKFGAVRPEESKEEYRFDVRQDAKEMVCHSLEQIHKALHLADGEFFAIRRLPKYMWEQSVEFENATSTPQREELREEFEEFFKVYEPIQQALKDVDVQLWKISIAAKCRRD